MKRDEAIAPALSIRLEVAMGLALAAVCLIGLIIVAQAAAYVDPPVKLGAESANLSGSEGLLLENSPRKIEGVTTDATTEAAYQAEMEASNDLDSTVSSELRSESDNLLDTSEVWDWELVPEVAVGGGAFYAGYEIGSVIWGAFFGEAAPPVGRSESFPVTGWAVRRPGRELLSDENYIVTPGTGTIYAPEWGLVSQAAHVSGVESSNPDHCELRLYGGGIPLYGGLRYAHNCEAEFVRDYVRWRPLEFAPCDPATTCEGIEAVPYEGANQPIAPSAAELRVEVEAELQTEKYPVLNRFLNYQIEPQNYPNPRVTKKEVDEEERRCDRGVALFENPGGNESPEPFAKREEAGFTVTSLPAGFETASPVYLRWGTTSWGPTTKKELNGPRYLDDWTGWGWRHIAAKHGWNVLDREETAEALAVGAPQPATKTGKFVYEAPVEKGVGGVECVRVVAVDFATGGEDPGPRGIVTSFNKVG